MLRLVLSGALDHHPGLKLIIGHMGEGLPTMLARFDEAFGPEVARYLRRTMSEAILDQVYVTTSGLFSLVPFLPAFMTFGADRMLFAVDYPYSSSRAGRKFLDGLPISAKDKAKIAYENASKLLKIS